MQYHLPMGSRELCIALLEDCGVMLTPGVAMDMEGYLRIGYANDPAILQRGLDLMSDFLTRQA